MTATALPFAPLWLATILLTLVVAIRAAIPRRRARPIRLKVLGRALMPARMLRSASGRLDIAAFLFATMIATSVLGWALVSADWWALRIAALVGPVPATIPGWIAAPLATLLLFLAYEFAYWFYHMLSHRIAWLWAFHKVHHSAESLSLLTNFRVHPVDTIVFYNFAAFVTGVIGGLVAPFCGPSGPWVVGNANLLVFVSSILLSYLQHSHLWISWPGRLGRWLMSPAAHQLHHSIDPRHHDRNFGSTVALFDWLGGTLLLPTGPRQKLQFGLADAGRNPHGFAGAVLRPFGEAALAVAPRIPSARREAI